jgi:hypothetical protein
MANPTGKGGFGDHPEHRNTTGRNRGPRVSDLLAKIGQQLDPSDPKGLRTKAEAVANAVYDLALQGDKWCIKFLVERTEGKAVQPVEDLTPDIASLADRIQERANEILEYARSKAGSG